MNPFFIRNNYVLASIVLFLFFFISIQSIKPSFLYNNDGSIRQFGIGYKNKTIFPVWLLAIVFGILSYLFVRYYLVNYKFD